MTINTGGPAYPTNQTNNTGNGTTGMTLRDYFASQTFPIQSPCGDFDADEFLLIARNAYAIADAMLIARNE